MQFGVCCGSETAGVVGDAGYVYFEMTVGGFLKPLEPEAAFREELEKVRAAPIPCLVLNCFIPGEMKITGPDIDGGALADFVAVACERAAIAGVDTIVFGSGGARRIPDGFDRERAWEQLIAFCRTVAPVAEENRVTIAVEPLNSAECNVINSVGEGARLVRDVDHPNIRLLVDAYHWARDNESPEGLIEGGALLAHAHIATTETHKAPGAELCDFEPFFHALAQSGYDGRISIEASLPDPETDLPRALEVMKNYWRLEKPNG